MDPRARSDREGQVSEVDNLGDADEIEPSDAVAGHPDDRDVQEGATGPDARTGDQEPD
ncbi:hypothetical protein GUY44_21110 [Pimelobacter simplex]|uniref:Uncharacterized protein n=1 Tax=Nocardioides simplex TaxID=2045 RepID=A0A0C5XG48_NOCSI|nr:hypothetical protein [Pimelobacter simplex]AJR18161.1 hypothetical protein KR76_00048 [Pimelobacter simplex]MCG8152996.1 hypothetical protein [Pimelobacter simplex]GEB11963.1 hypothetical protein NSI01_02780 [Pimelobacter simplex]SFN03790.1 hypothetical protein SAMN05421671_4823 [Pimelobacter simplex]